VAEAGGSGLSITVCDINAEMLAVGRERAAARGLDGLVTFEQGNAEELPYADRSFDCVTIAFGIRNVPRIQQALSEAYRVLKIGGRFLCLEFSAADLPGLDKLYDLYSFNVIPRVGELVTGDREAYQYLVESIRKFPKPKVFARMIEEAGFRRASFTSMTGGIVALHSGWKL
jgi:demethylmenaquinone methyltransferase/2-methoxy-6-polyprenyl-1,4-benzoquinol methylase